VGQQEEEEEVEVQPTTIYKLDWTVFDGSGRDLPMRNEYMRLYDLAWRLGRQPGVLIRKGSALVHTYRACWALTPRKTWNGIRGLHSVFQRSAHEAFEPASFGFMERRSNSPILISSQHSIPWLNPHDPLLHLTSPPIHPPPPQPSYLHQASLTVSAT